jgi:phosphate:Na+ symporter
VIERWRTILWAMGTMVFQLAGGIGLFLLGMVLLTDGLKTFAGDSLRRALLRFTGRPISAFASGAVATAVVQSSSATTVTVIGFVSAGLLTFPQALGVVMGASLGTTATGWIVSVLGLKFSIGIFSMPLVGAGALMRLLGRGRWQSLGWALAGFGLIFIGIDTLQQGMKVAGGIFKLSELPSSGLLGHALTMLIGLAMTVVLQSSSAAVATTLTALHSGSVNFEQASSLVIGAAIGTTVTGALAAIGGSTPAKRTALAHVLFNTATGLIAIVLLPVFLRGIGWAQTHLGLDAGAESLAAFHTSFILVGCVVFLPFVDKFARWIERLVPERGLMLTRHLDASLLNIPSVALETVRRALRETALEMFGMLREFLEAPSQPPDPRRAAQVHQALEQTHQFFTRIPTSSSGQQERQLRVSTLHAMDHLVRMEEYAAPPGDVRAMLQHEQVRPAARKCIEILQLAAEGLRGAAQNQWVAAVEQKSKELAELRRAERVELLNQTAAGKWDSTAALDALDAMRWLDRVGYHVWRISHYLGRALAAQPVETERTQEP